MLSLQVQSKVQSLLSNFEQVYKWLSKVKKLFNIKYLLYQLYWEIFEHIFPLFCSL